MKKELRQYRATPPKGFVLDQDEPTQSDIKLPQGFTLDTDKKKVGTQVSSNVSSMPSAPTQSQSKSQGVQSPEFSQEAADKLNAYKQQHGLVEPTIDEKDPVKSALNPLREQHKKAQNDFNVLRNRATSDQTQNANIPVGIKNQMFDESEFWEKQKNEKAASNNLQQAHSEIINQLKNVSTAKNVLNQIKQKNGGVIPADNETAPIVQKTVDEYNVANKDNALVNKVAKSKDIKDFVKQYSATPILNEQTLANKTLEAINDPNVEEAYKQNPKKWNEFLKAKSDYNNLFPKLAKQRISSQVAQWREDLGNNSPIYNDPSKENLDKIVEEKFKNGEMNASDRAFYYQNIKPSDIPTTGFINELGRNYEQATRNSFLGRALSGVGLLENPTEKYKYAPQVEPTKNQISGGTGALVGQLAPIALTNTALKGAGFSDRAANFISAINQFGGQNEDRANELFPNDPAKKWAYTTLGSAIDALITEVPILKGKSGALKTEAENLSQTLADNTVNSSIKEQAKKNFLNRVQGFIGSTVKNTAHTSGILTGMEALHKGLDVAANAPNAVQNINNTNFVDEFIKNAKSSILLGGFQALGKLAPETKVENQIETKPTGVANEDIINAIKNHPNVPNTISSLLDSHPNEIVADLKEQIKQGMKGGAENVTDAINGVYGKDAVELAKKQIENEQSGNTTSTTPTTEQTGAEVRDTKDGQAGVNTTDNGLQDGNRNGGGNVGDKEVDNHVAALNKMLEDSQPKDYSKLSDADIEKRMLDLEDSKTYGKEFDDLEKEMEKRERASVFNVPLEKVSDAVDDLMKKDKEQPNGYGSFIERRDANETKDVAEKYLNPKEISDAELKKDFKDAVMGRPETWYADGLKLRESMKEAANRGIETQDLVREIEKEFERDGYSAQEAKEVVARRLAPIFKDGKQVADESKQIANEIPISTEEKSNTIKEANTVEQPTGEGEKTSQPIENEPIGKSNEGQPPSQEPPVESKGAYVERPATELSHRGLQDVANEFSLSDVESRDTKTDVQLRQDAENTINDWKEKGEYGNKIEELTKKAESKGVLNDEERVIMEQHLANVIGEARKLDKNSPEYDAKLQEIKRLKDAGQITRSAAGAALRIPTNSGSYPRTVEDAMVDRMNALGAKTLTPEQKKDVEGKFAELEKNLADEKAKREDAERKNAELQAQLEIANQKKATKQNTKKDFKKEREDIRASIREKLKKSRSQANDVTTAIVDFAKIAPDVAKLMKSYVEEGIVTFSELIDKLHNDLKEDAPEIKRQDVVDIIAGKYDTPKETKIDLLNKLKQIKDKKSAEAIKIKAKLESGDFERKTKPKSWVDNPEFARKYPKEYKETLDAIRRADDAKHEMALANLKAQIEQRTKWQKAVALGGKALRTAKALKAGIDFSATLVQNLMAIMAHPIIGAKGTVEAFRDFGSADRFERGLARLHNSEAWPLIEQSGLSVVDPKGLRENEKNDIYNDTFLDNNIGKYTTKPFERHFTSLGNFIRTNLFLRKAEQLMQEGKTFETHPEDFKSVAATINNMTGRGTMTEGLESHNELLSSLLWSPRLLASTLNVLGIGDAALAMTGKKGFYRSLTPSQRGYAIKEISKGIGMGIAVMAAIAYATGGKADLNPTSVTFGTVQNGDNRWTVFGRFTSLIRMLAMLISRQRTTEKGTQELDASRNGDTSGNEMWKFIRGKMNPSLSYGVDIVTNTTFNGGKPTLKGELQNALYPMAISDVVAGIKQDGMSGLLIRGIPSIFGAKVSNENDFIQQNTFDQKAIINGQERSMTDDEFQNYAKKKKEIEQSELDKFKKLGMYVTENGKAVYKTYSQLSSKDRQSKINSISIAASNKAKEVVFGKQDKSKADKVAETKAEKLNSKLYK